MSSPKGYPSSKLLDRLLNKHTTVEPIRLNQQGLSVLSHEFVALIASDVTEAGSTVSTIVATAHVATPGSIIRFSSGVLIGIEVKVFSVTTNAIVLCEDLTVAPTIGDGFDVLSHRYPVLDSQGRVITSPSSSGIVSFIRNTVTTPVNQDTAVSANNRPLPVMLLDAAGNINTVAAVQSGNWDIQDITGAITLPTGASTEATLALLEAKDFSTETTLAAMSAKLPATLGQKLSAASMSVVLASDQALPLPAGAATEATLASLDSKDFATETMLAAVKGDTASLVAKDFATQTTLAAISAKLPATLGQKLEASSLSVVLASDQVLPLPTGAATEVTLAAASAKLPATLGQKNMANSLAVVLSSDQSAIPVTGTFWQTTQPVSGTVAVSNFPATQTVAGTVAVSNFPASQAVTGTFWQATQPVSGTVAVSNFPASQAVTGTFWQATQPVSGTVAVSNFPASQAVTGTFWQATQPVSAASLPLPTGASTEATLALISASVSRLDVIDFIDTTPVLDTSSTNITASSGNPVAIVATLAAAVKKIMVNDTTGGFIGVYTGAALSEVLQCVIGPGLSGAIEVQMSAGERVSLRNMANTAITDGMVAIQFIG